MSEFDNIQVDAELIINGYSDIELTRLNKNTSVIVGSKIITPGKCEVIFKKIETKGHLDDER